MIDETVREIQEMRTHSSSTVAKHAARALKELEDRDFRTVDEFLQNLERNSTVLRQANPSHASLQSTQREIVATVREPVPESVEAAQERLQVAIDDTVEEIAEATDKTAVQAQSLLEDGDVILTHDFSRTVLAVLRQSVEAGREHRVFTTEARPRFMGRRMGRELGRMEGIDPTLIVDSAAGHYLTECDRVIVGMDCIVDDVLYNRVGTLPVAATAAHLGVPMTVVGAASKVVETGFQFENDFRSTVEVMREPTTSFRIENPAYDATPVSLLETVVTDDGIREISATPTQL